MLYCRVSGMHYTYTVQCFCARDTDQQQKCNLSLWLCSNWHASAMLTSGKTTLQYRYPPPRRTRTLTSLWELAKRNTSLEKNPALCCMELPEAVVEEEERVRERERDMERQHPGWTGQSLSSLLRRKSPYRRHQLNFFLRNSMSTNCI